MGLETMLYISVALIAQYQNVRKRKLTLLSFRPQRKVERQVKSPHQKFGYFLSGSQQNSKFSYWKLIPKTEGTKTKAARCRYVGCHTNLETYNFDISFF